MSRNTTLNSFNGSSKRLVTLGMDPAYKYGDLFGVTGQSYVAKRELYRKNSPFTTMLTFP